jgi:hypothetical protein
VSRTFYTQKLLPGAGAAKMEETLDSGRSEDKKTAVASTAATAPKDFVRTNAADQKMDRFLVKKTGGGESAGDQEKRIPQQVEQELETGGTSGAASRPDCQLTSVKALRLQLQVSILVRYFFASLKHLQNYEVRIWIFFECLDQFPGSESYLGLPDP